MQTPVRAALSPSFLATATILTATLVLLVGLGGCTSGGATGGPRLTFDGPRLTFEERERNFGQVSASQRTEHQFRFRNTGPSPLEISDVRPEPPRPGA